MGNHRCNPMANLWDRDRIMASDINEYSYMVDTSISSEITINKKEEEKLIDKKTLLNDTKKIFKKSTGLSVLTILVS